MRVNKTPRSELKSHHNLIILDISNDSSIILITIYTISNILYFVKVVDNSDNFLKQNIFYSIYYNNRKSTSP